MTRAYVPKCCWEMWLQGGPWPEGYRKPGQTGCKPDCGEAQFKVEGETMFAEYCPKDASKREPVVIGEVE